MGEKTTKERVGRWWLNTYFIFGFFLLIISILGFARGADYIRDPGQPDNSRLAWWYLFAAGLFFLNGFVSHTASLKNELAAERED